MTSSQLAALSKQLRNLKIGQQLSWTLGAEGDLQRLTWEVSRREARTYDRTATGFQNEQRNAAGRLG